VCAFVLDVVNQPRFIILTRRHLLFCWTCNAGHVLFTHVLCVTWS